MGSRTGNDRRRTRSRVADVSTDALPFEVHLLDVGEEEYGDAVLCEFGATSVLIDGAHTGNWQGSGEHPSIPDQLASFLGQGLPAKVDLLVVSHAHEDHIGCLPTLVDRGLLQAKHALVTDPDFGWGKTGGDAASGASDATRMVLAGLREEIRSDASTDEEVERLLDDAVTLETRYRKMLQQLAHAGTRIVRFGKDSDTKLRAFLRDERDVQLTVLGPRKSDLPILAKLLRGAQDQFLGPIDAIRTSDASASPLALYRRLTRAADAVDLKRIGSYVNLQSLVTLFEYRGKRCLFTGDMQLADPDTSNATLRKGMATLLGKIEKSAPYTLVKLAHHGSWNGLSEDVLRRMKTPPVLGICAGTGSTSHPSLKTLDLLRAHANELQWARTDRNGDVTVGLGTKTTIRQRRGKLNDLTPPSSDMPGASTPSSETQVHRIAVGAGESSNQIEVTTRIPFRGAKVTLTVEVQPVSDAGVPVRVPPNAKVVTDPEELLIGGGRELPPLLYLTDTRSLTRNVGAATASKVLAALKRAPGLTLDPDLSDSSAADVEHATREILASRGDLRGVVLVGGYDVVPSQRMDCLPPKLRAEIDATVDLDGFVVWSDDLYGDVDEDGLAELPVTRVPDAGSGAFLLKALRAERPTPTRSKAGVRNVARPFADSVYEQLPGTGEMYRSEPVVHTELGPKALAHERVYLMLHGSFDDTSRFWGEPDDLVAMTVDVVPEPFSGVVLSGCCWGALSADLPASQSPIDLRPRARAPRTSIALQFLATGANAFVGCTGAHYSPQVKPYRYFGQPMHHSFWKHYDAGHSAAEALLKAKEDYARALPHGRKDPEEVAIEFKILRQFTCLGLAW